jgi:flagellar hook protein FlgE
MDVTGIALGGLEAAQSALETSAKRLAGVGTTSADGTVDGVDLSTEMVALLSARQQFQVNARVIHTADEMQKSLVDLLG